MRKVNVPCGESGNWKIEKFTVSKDAAKWEAIKNGIRAVEAGDYTRLMYGRDVIMSDTNTEMDDHAEIFRQAKGHVLINGLGIGMILQAVIEKPEVTKVTVIEKCNGVLELVADHYKGKYGDKLEIINADAFEYKPPKGVRYGAVWHDIWTFIASENYEGMKKLHRKYGRRCDWQGSWCRWEVEQKVKEEKKNGYYKYVDPYEGLADCNYCKNDAPYNF